MRVMSLNQLSSQTGLYVSTLRRVAKRVCGRSNGAFTEEECAAILESLKQTRTLAYAQERLQKKASSQKEAFPKKASSQKEAFPKKASSQKEAFPKKASSQKEAFPKKASSQKEAFPKKASSQKEAFSYNQTPVTGDTIQLSSDVVKALDNLLQFKIPHYRDCPNHLAALTTFLTAAGNKGKAVYDKDLIEARQLAEEYNQWVDSQL